MINEGKEKASTFSTKIYLAFNLKGFTVHWSPPQLDHQRYPNKVRDTHHQSKHYHEVKCLRNITQKTWSRWSKKCDCHIGDDQPWASGEGSAEQNCNGCQYSNIVFVSQWPTRLSLVLFSARLRAWEVLTSSTDHWDCQMALE